jgi:hypothetical protein
MNIKHGFQELGLSNDFKIDLVIKKLVRNKEIQRIFEIADDSLQGMLGYHFYLYATYLSADPDDVKVHLPTISGFEVFRHTFSWVRRYRKEDLINAFLPPYFEFLQARFSLIAITSVFDDFLNNIVKELDLKGHTPQLDLQGLGKNPNYWKRLKWAFHELQKCTIGDLDSISRLPRTFGIIDEARILRNLIVHNHGIFNKRYETDKIHSKEILRINHPDYQKSKDIGDNIPIIIKYEDVINFSCAHIEVLHILHNQIQKKYFGHPDPYDYEKEGKDIRWEYALWGNAKKDYINDNIIRESYVKL